MRASNGADQERFVVIRHVRETGHYAIEYGEPQALKPGPRFTSLDRAIAWVEKFDRAASSGGEVGDD